jgi:uncharacterized membrane protein
VTVASGLTVTCLFALLFYIHKIARSIVPDNVVETAAAPLRSDLRQILGSDAEGDALPELPSAPRKGIGLGRSGYIQVVDYDPLVRIAERAGAILDVQVRAGHYVLKVGDHVVAYGAELHDKAVDDIRAAFTVGTEPTPAQDQSTASGSSSRSRCGPSPQESTTTSPPWP